MSTFYFFALCGVSAIVLGVMFDAVARVSRKPDWQLREYAAPVQIDDRPLLAEIVVRDVDARHSGFVGLTNREEFQISA